MAQFENVKPEPPQSFFTNCRAVSGTGEPPPTPSARDIHFGADALKQFREGKNPPSWIGDEDVWEKAKEAALKSYDMDDDVFWPSVVKIYRSMGGTEK